MRNLTIDQQKLTINFFSSFFFPFKLLKILLLVCSVASYLNFHKKKKKNLDSLLKFYFDGVLQIWWEDEKHIAIFAPNVQSFEEAKEVLEGLLKEDEPTFEFMGIYKAKVTEVRPIGVMVTLYDGMKPILLHNSVLSERKVCVFFKKKQFFFFNNKKHRLKKKQFFFSNTKEGTMIS